MNFAPSHSFIGWKYYHIENFTSFSVSKIFLQENFKLLKQQLLDTVEQEKKSTRYFYAASHPFRGIGKVTILIQEGFINSEMQVLLKTLNFKMQTINLFSFP